MIKVTVRYPYSEGARFNHACWRDRHMPMVLRRHAPVVQISEVVVERSDR